MSDDDVVGLPQALRRRQPAASAAQSSLSRAVATLIELLLAPLVPQSRRAMLSGFCAGWRLSTPPVVQPARGDVALETAAQKADKKAFESLAEQCAAVYLVGRRRDETAS
jgi:hypothetical protein